MIRVIADRIHLTVRPKPGERLSADQVTNLARMAHGEVVEIGDDGAARLAFAADRYTAEVARGNLEMTARMALGPHWQTRYVIEDAAP
jgi:hypothetical protein